MNGKGMGGDFRGDFSRDTFDPTKQFSRVLMQQGRVQLDADWNEQVSILLHYMRQLGADLMGPHGAPATVDGYPGRGFCIADVEDNDKEIKAFIAKGTYYVNGIVCDNDEEHHPVIFSKENGAELYLIYLDVWECHVSSVEDDCIREKALGGTDTATRAKIVWQVRIKPKTIAGTSDRDYWAIFSNNNYKRYEDFLNVLGEQKQLGTGQLKARARKASEKNNEPCLTAPEASYRGVENQLYRVEIHNLGEAEKGATFKWSRENGSVIFPIRENGNQGSKDSDTTILELEHLGYDYHLGLQLNNLVEVLDDDLVLRNEAKPLLEVIGIDREGEFPKVTLRGTAEYQVGKHPYLRRWDHCGDIHKGITVEQDRWITLENGIEIYFQKDENAVYQTGDYWLIPARTATGDVEWPLVPDSADPKKKVPDALLPQGVEHHYAPLAIITVEGGNVKSEPTDLRRQLQPMWKVARANQ